MRFSIGHRISILLSLTIGLASATTLKVCSSGCTYKTISAAIAAIPSGTTSYTVSIAPGTYNEKVSISRSNVILKNSGTGTVLVEYSAGHNTQSSTGSDTDSAVLTITGTNVAIYNITFANTFTQTRNYANLALDLAGSEAGFYNVKFYGFQDTLLINRGGSGYFKSCYIEGSVDFIWGYGTGYFQGCTVASNSAGSVTAHNRASSSATGGFYFNSCTIKSTVPSGPIASTSTSGLSFASTSAAAHTCYLGRPWSKYARVVYLYSSIGNHIALAGWSEWSTSSPNTGGVLFGEYDNSGASAWNSARASFATKLSATKAAYYTPTNIFGSISWIDSSV